MEKGRSYINPEFEKEVKEMIASGGCRGNQKNQGKELDVQKTDLQESKP